MSRIDQLCEQTEFLLQKQQEILNMYGYEFEKFSQLLDDEIAKAEQVNDGEKLEHLQNIYSKAEAREEDLKSEVAEDIVFLEEQLDALNQVKALEDEKKQEELVTLMLEEQEAGELSDTQEFKAAVEEEAKEANQEFKSLIEDLNSALVEGRIDEIESFLEDQLEDSDENEDEESCGSSCSGCGEKEMCGREIFEGLEEKEDFDKDNESDKEKCNCDDDDCNCD
jgi:hypothetical protein